VKASSTVDQVIVDTFLQSLSLHQALLADQTLIETVGSVAEEMVRALSSGRKLFFFGNGGSAADAQHLAAELVGRFKRERRALPALALTADTSTLTAIGNDYSYDQIFARQLEGLGSPGDVALGISTSGKSPNVIQAFNAAKKIGMVTVGITGAGGGQVAPIVDYCICVPSDHTARIQEAHILVGHILCEIIDEKFVSEHDAS
jgi:D-sedoheptulose 7-phosphate isomerase